MLNGFGDRKAIEALMAELRAQYYVEVDYSVADMSRPEQGTEMVEQCVGRFGGVDIRLVEAEASYRRALELVAAAADPDFSGKLLKGTTR